MNSYLKNIKLIGWDLDGTLYPFNADLSAEIDRRKNLVVAKHLDCSLDEAKNKFLKLKKILKSSTQTLDTLGLDGKNFFIKTWQEIDLSQFIKPNPKLVELLSAVGEILPQAMLTNSNSLENIEYKLGLIGIKSKQFSPIITSVEVSCHKPDSKIFQIFIDEVGLKPSQILYVGDREKVDLIPAKKLGFKTCLVGAETIKADFSVKTPIQLLEMFV